jgi:hypothetical protein
VVLRELRLPVQAGGSLAVGEYWTPVETGPHEIACEVNPGRQPPEQVYTDNVRSRSVDVRPKGAPRPAAPAPAAATVPAPATPAPPASVPPVAAAPAPEAAVKPAPPALAAPAPSPAAAPPAGPAAPAAPGAKPDLAIVAVKTAAEPNCDSRDPSVTVHAVVKNVGAVAYAPTRAPALLEATVTMPNDTSLIGRRPVPRLEPGASAELEVVSRGRRPIPNAGGLRYSVVITVNGDGRVEEVTLDNNGEYVKAAAFPRC